MTDYSILGSGSTGNAVLLHGARGLLLDAGFTARTLTRRIEAAGLPPGNLDGIVLTHEHGDHARGAPLLAAQLGIPVYGAPGTLEALPDGPFERRPMQPGRTFHVGDFSVRLFAVPHDAAEPVGVRVETQDVSLGYLTDAGHVTPEAEAALADCQHLLVEANHDPELLRHGPYPYPLKHRISGGHGHLSNDACGTLLGRLVDVATRRIVLHHLSRNNNTPELALATTHAILHRLGVTRPPLVAAPAHGPFGPFPF